MNFHKILNEKREIIQLVYGIVLVVLIPLLIVYNTVFIIKKYNASIDEILQRHAQTLGRSISTLISSDLPWENFIQIKIDALMKQQNEILEMSVLTPEDKGFKVIASSDKQNVGQVSNFYYYRMVWLQTDNQALATNSNQIDQALGAEQASLDNERFWLVTVPMNDSNGKKQALLAIKLSSEIVDQLTNDNRNASIWILVGTMFIVILFLLVAIRTWDYVLLYQKIKAVDDMKDEFISMATHELRTPVTGIKGYSSMILDGSMGEVSTKVLESVEIIYKSSERLEILVKDLLDVGRIEQGRVKMDLNATDINPIINSTVRELHVQADSKNLQLIYKPHLEALPLINIDVDRFKQVLINLIGNAIKYTEKGKVEIFTEEKYGGRILEIRINDTGIGMSEEDKDRLFEKFYRIKNNRTKGIAGSGLGLWITKQLVELMDGTITIDSIENVGTQITLQFPIVRK